QAERRHELHQPDETEVKCGIRQGVDMPGDRCAQHGHRGSATEAAAEIEDEIAAEKSVAHTGHRGVLTGRADKAKVDVLCNICPVSAHHSLGAGGGIMTAISRLLIAAVLIAVCNAVPAGAQVCNDFDQCTNPDMCTDGTCTGTPISGGTCDDGRECTT